MIISARCRIKNYNVKEDVVSSIKGYKYSLRSELEENKSDWEK